jgi:hypothetical protein
VINDFHYLRHLFVIILIKISPFSKIMARINNRKTKPSKKSKVRRRQFLQDQKLLARRDYAKKEEETTKKIEFLQAELENERRLYQKLREEKKQERITMRNEQKGLLAERDRGWQNKIKERDEKWERCWKRREEVVREENRKEKEREKQNILQDRAKLFQDKRKVEFERDRLLERVEELEGELGDFKEKYLGFRS